MSGILMYVSCLANDQNAFKQWEKTFKRTKILELIDNSRVEALYSQALAECGNIDKAWGIMRNISGKFGRGITDWILALDPLYQHYFSEIPEYKAMVKRLEEEKSKRKDNLLMLP